MRRAGVKLVIALLAMTVTARGDAMEMKPLTGGAATIVPLPQPRRDSNISVERALRLRRSVRDYLDGPLTLAEAGQLLWAAQGLTTAGGLRTAPSAGALYPLELHLVAGNITGLAAGTYRYLPREHALKPYLSGDRRARICAASLGQAAIRRAPAALVFTAIFTRTTGKYGERGVRYVYMDHGHAAENVYLQAASLQLGTVLIGAFDDAEVKRALALHPDEEPLSIMPVGRLRGATAAD